MTWHGLDSIDVKRPGCYMIVTSSSCASFRPWPQIGPSRLAAADYDARSLEERSRSSQSVILV